MKLAIASLSNLINQVCCIKHMQFTIRIINEMNYLSQNIDWIFDCRGHLKSQIDIQGNHWSQNKKTK